MKNIDLKITIEPDNDIPAFAGYCNHSGPDGAPKIVFNFMSMIIACAENGDSAKDYKLYFSESVVHEMLHMVQDIFDKAFSEEEVEDAITKTREFLEKDI